MKLEDYAKTRAYSNIDNALNCLGMNKQFLLCLDCLDEDYKDTVIKLEELRSELFDMIHKTTETEE